MLKACSFNLILYTHESRRTDHFRQLIRTIIQKFPCRIILIEAKNDLPPDHLKVETSTQTTGVIVCDQIEITTSFPNLKRVPYIVVPNLAPDLPIYLIWGQDPTCENELLPFFYQIAHRFIFDSECTPDLHRYSQKMLQLIDSVDIDFIDMHWALLSGWRKLFASVFDSEEKIRALQQCKKMEIIYNCRQTDWLTQCDTESLYLKAWLKAQLGWKTTEVTLKSENHPTYPPGGIIAVNMQCENHTEFSLSREKQWSKAVCHICYEDKCEAPLQYQMPDLEKDVNFMRELFFGKPSEQYRSMLREL